MENITDLFEDGIFVKRIIKRTFENEEKERVGEILNYPHLDDMIYEDNIKEAIKLIIDKVKEKPINLLFYGSPGTGKTATAQMIATETHKPFVYITGTQGNKKILNILMNAKENSIILVDEIHNLPEKVAEIIYPSIQDGEIYINGYKIKLRNLMFIGTTTEPEKLPKPLINRFSLIEFEDLSLENLKKLLIKKNCDEKVIEIILNYTTNVRIINNLIEMIKLYGEINEENLIKVFRLKKINIYSGLSDYQEKYLNILKNSNKPIGLRSLSLQLQKTEDYIKYEIEPDLIRKKMIIITSKGREIYS